MLIIKQIVSFWLTFNNHIMYYLGTIKNPIKIVRENIGSKVSATKKSLAVKPICMKTQSFTLCQDRSPMHMTINSYHKRNITSFINLSLTKLAHTVPVYRY